MRTAIESHVTFVKRIKINNLTMASYSFLVSFVLLLFSTRSSPMYPFNDWVDSNAFFTMGKGMMNGKILYRDLFEQKGPYLYLVHGLSYLISNTTFLGVFFFEVISFSIFLFFCYKIISLFLDVKYSLISIPLIATCILSFQNFYPGDSAEEFSLPFLIISLYFLLKYFKNIYPNPISYKWLLINGIVAGVILWIKFTLLGFWFGWILTVCVCMLVNRQYLRMIFGSLIFLCGMLIATIPWIIYFGINNAIYSWINTYIIFNIKYYSVNYSLLLRLKFVAFNIYYNLKDSPIFSLITFIGIIFFISNRYLNYIFPRICIIFTAFFLSLGVYGGGTNYPYYFLIFSAFVIFGFIVILDFLSSKLNKRISINLSIASVLLSILITITFNHNTYMLKSKKEDLVQYRFANIINKTKNATLLNYGSLDLGVYTLTGITPNVRYFEDQNVDYSKYPYDIDEQNEAVKNKEVDYIVTTGSGFNKLESSVPNLHDNYELISKQSQTRNGVNFEYYLLKER